MKPFRIRIFLLLSVLLAYGVAHAHSHASDEVLDDAACNNEYTLYTEILPDILYHDSLYYILTVNGGIEPVVDSVQIRDYTNDTLCYTGYEQSGERIYIGDLVRGDYRLWIFYGGCVKRATFSIYYNKSDQPCYAEYPCFSVMVANVSLGDSVYFDLSCHGRIEPPVVDSVRIYDLKHDTLCFTAYAQSQERICIKELPTGVYALTAFWGECARAMRFSIFPFSRLDPDMAVDNPVSLQTATKQLRNGRLYLVTPEGNMYDITGRRVGNITDDR